MSKAKDLRPKTKDLLGGIILAAGQSKRMGRLKPLLPFGQKTVIENCIDYLASGGVESIVVVLGHQADAIKEKLKHLSVQIAFNPNPESEMGASIACGVRALPLNCQATFITPADYPAVPPSVVITLANNWRRGDGNFLIPEYAGHGGHPVLVDLRFRHQLLRLDPQRGLRGLCEDHNEQVRRVPVESPFVARDLDTWDDYLALHQDVFGTGPLEEM